MYNHFALHQKLTQHCKSTMIQRIFFKILRRLLKFDPAFLAFGEWCWLQSSECALPPWDTDSADLELWWVMSSLPSFMHMTPPAWLLEALQLPWWFAVLGLWFHQLELRFFVNCSCLGVIFRKRKGKCLIGATFHKLGIIKLAYFIQISVGRCVLIDTCYCSSFSLTIVFVMWPIHMLSLSYLGTL